MNDATGLVLYRFAVATVLTGAFSGLGAGRRVCLHCARGHRARRRNGLDHVVAPGAPARSDARARDVIDDALRDILGLRGLEVSGVLGVVAVGLYRSQWAHRGSSALARLNIRTFWGALVFVVNCLVFVLIGIRCR